MKVEETLPLIVVVLPREGKPEKVTVSSCKNPLSPIQFVSKCITHAASWGPVAV